MVIHQSSTLSVVSSHRYTITPSIQSRSSGGFPGYNMPCGREDSYSGPGGTISRDILDGRRGDISVLGFPGNGGQVQGRRHWSETS